MNYIGLNHVLTKNKFNIIAITLLVIGNVLSVVVFLYCYHLSNETDALQIDIRQQSGATNKLHLNRPLLQSKAKSSALKSDEVMAVKSAIKEIALPWSALFKSLESVSVDVKLLALEPNAKQRTLHITAVALDSDSMMRYVDELAQQKILKEVVLKSQEPSDINGLKAIKFEIGASWQI